jgi:large subunit ribosomal protein L17
MRHRRDHRQLSRTAEHRKALLRNLVTALFEHERIETSVAKAKEARRLAEKLITFAKRGDLSARRQVERYLYSETVAKKLFDTIAPWYAERPGGYTRIIRLGKRRVGDASEVALLELIKSDEQKAAEKRARDEAAKAKEGDKKAKGKRAKEKEKEKEEEEVPAGESK